MKRSVAPAALSAATVSPPPATVTSFPAAVSSAAVCAISTVPMSKGSTFISLGDNSLNYEILGETGFRTMVRLVDQCDCYALRHASASEVVSALEGLLRKPAEQLRAAAAG